MFCIYREVFFGEIVKINVLITLYLLLMKTKYLHRLFSKVYWVLLLVSVLLGGEAAFAADIYVSPIGSDEQAGSKKYPLKTLSAAYRAALELFESGTDSEVIIWLEEGTYPQAEPLVISPFGANRPDRSLHIKAVKGAQPIVSGGVSLQGWRKNTEGLWETSLPQGLEGVGGFRELFLEGKRAVRARFPNEGYLNVKQAGADRRTNFFFEKGDFPIPASVSGLELVLLHDWSISRVGVKEIDPLKNQLIAKDSIGARSPEFFHIDNWEPNPRYFLENAPEFLDAAYEWIYLEKEKKFLLKLPEGVDPSDLKVVVPVAGGLLFLEGKEGNPVRNVSFEGITFQYSRWDIPAKGYCGIQACHFDPRPDNGAWAVVPAAVSATWSENISFDGCAFLNLGGSGLWLGTGTVNSAVLGSEFRDISGNGIMIGEGRDRIVDGDDWWKTAPQQAALGITVRDCTITEVGAQFFGAVGIWAGLTAETQIVDNHVFNLPYTGISIGWMWSPVPTPSRDNLLEGNHIHDIMKILSDGGGIYMLGLQPGSKLVNNRIHDVEINAGKAESNGMFLDEGITDVIVAENLVYNIAKSPLRFHRATVNTVMNNYFFCRKGNPPIRYNTTKEEDIKQQDNRSFAEGEPGYEEELARAIQDWEKRKKSSNR